MKVTLISHTQDAENLLIFTKATRLTLSPGLLDEIRSRPQEDKMRELEYMANTIPSSWEFVDYVFLVEGVSRAYTHQQVRTRAASYAQQTMRVLVACTFTGILILAFYGYLTLYPPRDASLDLTRTAISSTNEAMPVMLTITDTPPSRLVLTATAEAAGR